MRYNRHSNLEGRHAFLSPSSYHWLNYDDQKLAARFYTVSAAKRGTDMHDLAQRAIRLGIRIDPAEEAFAAYVNDAIDMGMTPEQPLFYSDNCFGTPDAILFRDMFLRIHDLKTGVTASKMAQLEVYDALFCLEYEFDPFEIGHELRIYQRNDVFVHTPSPEGISAIMEKIIDFDRKIEALKEDQPWQ